MWRIIPYAPLRQQGTRVSSKPARALPVKVTVSLLDLFNGQTPLQIISLFAGTSGDHTYGLLTAVR